MPSENRQLIIKALDRMAELLQDHGHKFSRKDRTLYETAISKLITDK
jgi:hypothetical protein